MTPEDVRGRLAVALLRRQTTDPEPCPRCHGTGTVTRREKVTTQAEIARAIGLSRAQVANFAIGKSDLSFPRGLALMAYLDDLEADGSGTAARESREAP